MGMTITNCWKLFRYGVKRDHYEKLIGIREFSERLAQNCFNNNFSSDSGTPAKNIPLLDEVDYEDTVSTCRSLQFSASISPSAAVSTISDLTQSSASHFPKNKKPSWEGDITGLLEVNVQGSCLTERYAYREAFGFATDVMVSTIKGCTIVNMFIVTVLQCIMTHLFVSLDMFVVCIFCYNDDCPEYHISAMMPFMPMRLYKTHDLGLNALSPCFS